MPVDSGVQEPLVSVVIPTYNRPSYLADAIASAVQQTYQNIEIVISDDCSAEHPQAIVDSFKDSRIKFRRNSSNLGVAANVSAAIQETRGKYIATLNDDDLWQKDFLENLVPPLEANPELVLAFCDYYLMNPDGTINNEMTEKKTQEEKRNQLQEGVYRPFWKIGLVDQAVFLASAAVVRKDAVKWNDIYGAGVFWDYYSIYLAARSGLGAYYCPQRLSLYRLSTLSVLRNPDPQAKIRKGKAGMFCHGRFMEDPLLQEFKPFFQRQWAEESTSIGIGLMRAKQLKEARPYLLSALKQQKLNLRTLVALTLSFTPAPIASRF
jgi:glycosyltransferase involved in cell wall biosynthesis